MSTLSNIKRFLRIIIQVDVIVALGGFSALLLDPLKNEYLYAAIGGSHNASGGHSPSCNANTTNAATEQIDHDVSNWTLMLDLAMFIPASISGILVTSWGDKVGRKVTMTIPLVGMTLSSAIFSLAIHFKWPLKSLYLYYLVAGMGGYYMSLLMQGIAYLSDTTTKENRGMRFVILETSLGISGGVAGVVSGYWVNAKGFFSPVTSTVFINLFALLLIPFLPDSKRKRERKREKELEQSSINEENEYPEVFVDDYGHDEENEIEKDRDFSTISLSSKYGSVADGEKADTDISNQKYTFLDIVRSVYRVYTSEYSHCEKCHGPKDENQNKTQSSVRCLHGGGYYPGRVWRMWFYLVSYDLYMFVVVGSIVFQTIFFLSEPLCFTSVLVGAQLAVKFTGVALSPFLVMFYKKCLDIDNNTIIIIGLIGQLSSCIIMSFATKTYIVFLATAVLAFANQAKPFIQAQVSGLVSETEQGSAFALQSCSEILTFLIATVIFLTMFPATVGIYHGFTWLFAAAVMLVPICLISCIFISDRRRSRLLESESQPLLS